MAGSNLAGTVLVFVEDGCQLSWEFASDLERLNVPEGTRKAFVATVEDADNVIQDEMNRGSSWFWAVGANQVYSPDVLELLLMTPGPIISPIVVSRNMPFYPSVSSSMSPDGRPIPLLLNEVTGPGTIQRVFAVSSLGVLLRREVFTAVDGPWMIDGIDVLCQRASAEGLDMYVTTSARMGERVAATLMPVHHAGKWHMQASVVDSTFMIPIRH